MIQNGPTGVPARTDEPMAARLDRLSHATWFHRFILCSIAVTGLLAGLETYPMFHDDTVPGMVVGWIQNLVLCVFVAELIIKVGSFGSQPWRYFQAGWNLFDFAIIVLCLLPLHAKYVVVFRLTRTLRLFTALPGLQVLISGLLHGIPSLGYVGLLLLLHFYIYAVIGTFGFGDNDPIRFGTLHTSMLTLFQVLTLEGWNDILNTQYHGSDIGYDEGWKQLTAEANRVSIGRPIAASAYFVSFILIGTMIILNVFTGVIIRSMESAEEAAKLERRLARGQQPRQDELRELSEQLQSIAQRLGEIEQESSASSAGGTLVAPGLAMAAPDRH
jgi:voltage-gated sodium channel